MPLQQDGQLSRQVQAQQAGEGAAVSGGGAQQRGQVLLRRQEIRCIEKESMLNVMTWEKKSSCGSHMKACA